MILMVEIGWGQNRIAIMIAIENGGDNESMMCLLRPQATLMVEGLHRMAV